MCFLTYYDDLNVTLKLELGLGLLFYQFEGYRVPGKYLLTMWKISLEDWNAYIIIENASVWGRQRLAQWSCLVYHKKLFVASRMDHTIVSNSRSLNSKLVAQLKCSLFIHSWHQV